MINDIQHGGAIDPTTEDDLKKLAVAPMSFFSEHWMDSGDCPAGGVSTGLGFTISWQNGPLALPEGGRRIPNGAFVESVIFAVMDRLELYQRSKFKCDENEAALMYLKDALEALEARTAGREARGVEGTLNV